MLIARALIADPEILILDEPSTGLDMYARDRMLRFIKNVAGEDTTVIYVTHYLEEVLEEFDNCLILKQGEIYACGKTADVLTQENLARIRV